MLWSLYGTMEVITKGADGSRSAVFMVPVKVLSARPCRQRGRLQLSTLGALVYLDDERVISREQQSARARRWLFENSSSPQVGERRKSNNQIYLFCTERTPTTTSKGVLKQKVIFFFGLVVFMLIGHSFCSDYAHTVCVCVYQLYVH